MSFFQRVLRAFGAGAKAAAEVAWPSVLDVQVAIDAALLRHIGDPQLREAASVAVSEALRDLTRG